jgi:hypothetical protein
MPADKSTGNVYNSFALAIPYQVARQQGLMLFYQDGIKLLNWKTQIYQVL